MRCLLALLVVVGCGNKDDPPAPAAKPEGSAGSAAKPAGPDPACLDDASKLRAWLRDLVAEGVQTFDARGTTLVKLDGVAPKPFEPAPVLTITAKEITVEG